MTTTEPAIRARGWRRMFHLHADHAGRPSVGFAPTRADIAFVHDRLIKKESNAQVGSLLTGVGFVVLLVVIL